MIGGVCFRLGRSCPRWMILEIPENYCPSKTASSEKILCTALLWQRSIHQNVATKVNVQCSPSDWLVSGTQSK